MQTLTTFRGRVQADICGGWSWHVTSGSGEVVAWGEEPEHAWAMTACHQAVLGAQLWQMYGRTDVVLKVPCACH